MTPVGRAIEEFRMQFPQHSIAPHMCIVGIATFVDTVESSLNRIACETVLSERTRAHVGLLIRTWALVDSHVNPADASVGPLMRTLTR